MGPLHTYIHTYIVRSFVFHDQVVILRSVNYTGKKREVPPKILSKKMCGINRSPGKSQYVGIRNKKQQHAAPLSSTIYDLRRRKKGCRVVYFFSKGQQRFSELTLSAAAAVATAAVATAFPLFIPQF